MLRTFAPIVLGLCAAASTAVAQTPLRHVSGYAIEEDAWRFVAIHSGTTSSPHIDAFVAVAKANVAVGDNIVVVAYIRGTTDADPWGAKTWTTTDRSEAVKQAKLFLNIDDADDDNWGLDVLVGAASPEMIEPAKDYSNGVMTDDPSYWWIATDPDNDQLIEVFKEWGLKVADIQLEKETPGCTTNIKLTAMAKGMETAIPMPITDQATLEAASNAGAAVVSSGFCQPATPPATPPPPPPTCVAGPLTPWVVTPWKGVGPIPATWTPSGGTWTGTPGGWTGTCTYDACRTYMQTRSCIWVRANCSTYTCTQIQTGTGCVTLTCTTSSTAPGTPSCPTSPVPWCTTTAPSGAAWPATPVVISPWGPPCN